MPAALPLLLVLLLSACATESSSQSRDLQSCRRAADSGMGPGVSIDPADEYTANPMVLANREALRDQYQTLVDQCMGQNR
jgi:hypothetical protein